MALQNYSVLPIVQARSLDHNSQLQPGLVLGMGTDLMAQLFKKKKLPAALL